MSSGSVEKSASKDTTRASLVSTAWRGRRAGRAASTNAQPAGGTYPGSAFGAGPAEVSAGSASRAAASPVMSGAATAFQAVATPGQHRAQQHHGDIARGCGGQTAVMDAHVDEVAPMEHGGAGRPHRRGVDRHRPRRRHAEHPLDQVGLGRLGRRPGRSPERGLDLRLVPERGVDRRRSPPRPGWEAAGANAARMARRRCTHHGRPPAVRHDERRVGELRRRQGAQRRLQRPQPEPVGRCGRPRQALRQRHRPRGDRDRRRSAHDVGAGVPEEVRDRRAVGMRPRRRRRRCGGHGCARRPSPDARSGAGRRRGSSGRRAVSAAAVACRRGAPAGTSAVRRGIEVDLPRPARLQGGAQQS